MCRGRKIRSKGSKGKQKNPLQLHTWNVPDTDKTSHLQEKDCPKIPHRGNLDGLSPLGSYQAGATGSTDRSANTKPHGRVSEKVTERSLNSLPLLEHLG